MTTFNPTFTITNRMTAAITQIERAQGFLEAARLSDDWLRDMGKQALIKEAHHTTHIEGTQNSRIATNYEIGGGGGNRNRIRDFHLRRLDV